MVSIAFNRWQMKARVVNKPTSKPTSWPTSRTSAAAQAELHRGGARIQEIVPKHAGNSYRYSVHPGPVRKRGLTTHSVPLLMVVDVLSRMRRIRATCRDFIYPDSRFDIREEFPCIECLPIAVSKFM